MKRKNLGQSVAEYIIITSVLLAAVLATGFIGHMRSAFARYFDAAKSTIVP